MWAGIPQWVSQRCAGAAQDLGPFMGNLLSTAFTTMVPPRLATIRLLHKLESDDDAEQIIKPIRASYSAPPPIDTPAEVLRNIGKASMTYNDIHSHCPTCHKGVRGGVGCRLAYSRPCSESCVPRIMSTISVNNVTYPRATEATPFVPVTLPSANVSASFSLNEQLFKLASPGFDDRLIEYPLTRLMIYTDIDNMDVQSDTEPNLTTVALLTLLYDRLVKICNNYGMEVVPIPEDTVITPNIVTIMLHTVVFGNQLANHSRLRDPTILSAIRDITRNDANLIKFLDYLSLQNALMGESSLAISAIIGCNFNSQPLVSTKASLSSIFYIIDYVTKDSMNPADLHGFIQAAKLRFRNYQSNIPAGEVADPSALRPERRLAQIVQNGIAGAAEISAQQCVLNIANLPSHDSNETFTFIFTRSAISSVRVSVERHTNVSDVDVTESVQSNINLAPVNTRRRLRIGSEQHTPLLIPITEDEVVASPVTCNVDVPIFTVDNFAAIDFDYQNNAPSVGTTHRNRAGDLQSTSQELEYLHRGEELSMLSLTEYACTVKRVAIKDIEVGTIPNISADANATEIPRVGRVANGVYQFSDGYPLSDSFVQQLRSLQTVPIFGGISSVPTWPKFKNIRAVNRRDAQIRDETNEYDAEENTFAEYILAILRPWPAPGFIFESSEQFTHIEELDIYLSQLQEGSFLCDSISGNFLGPPGYSKIILSGTLDNQATVFKQKCVARFIGSLAKGLRRDNASTKRCQVMWRARAAQAWHHPDPEQVAFPHLFAFNNVPNMDRQDYTEFHDNIDEERDAPVGVSEADVLAFNTALMESVNSNSYNMDAARIQQSIYLAEIDAAISIFNYSANLNHIARTSNSLPLPTIVGEFAASRSEITRILNSIRQPPPSIVLEPLVIDDFFSMAEPRIGLASDALNQIMSREIKRPNPEQLTVLLVVAVYLDEYGVNQIPLIPILIFLTGAAGTGKSFIFECIERMATAVRKKIAPTALTGVACTAIPTTESGAMTVHSFFKIPISCIIKPLTELGIAELDSRLTDVVIIIIDEIGFITAPLLVAVNKRLQEIRGNDLDFGGYGVIFSGDFYQLPPVRAIPLYKLALRLESPRISNPLILENPSHSTSIIAAKLFIKFRRYQLLTVCRSVEDQELTGLLNNFRMGHNEGIIQYLQDRLLTADDAVEFEGAPIISPGNLERLHCSFKLLSYYAHHRNDRVISWRLTATFPGLQTSLAQMLVQMSNATSVDTVYATNPELMQHFVAGAPIVNRHNTNPMRGLANGITATLYALEWSDAQIREMALQYLDEHAGDVVLPTGLEPSNILERPVLTELLYQNWPDNLSLYVPVFPSEDMVSDRVIIPIVKLKETILLKAGSCSLNVQIEKFQYDFTFMATVHLMQGQSLPKVIISLLERPILPTRNDWNAVYVALTRIKNGNNVRVIGKAEDLSFINSLKPPTELQWFNNRYDVNGDWTFLPYSITQPSVSITTASRGRLADRGAITGVSGRLARGRGDRGRVSGRVTNRDVGGRLVSNRGNRGRVASRRAVRCVGGIVASCNEGLGRTAGQGIVNSSSEGRGRVGSQVRSTSSFVSRIVDTTSTENLELQPISQSVLQRLSTLLTHSEFFVPLLRSVFNLNSNLSTKPDVYCVLKSFWPLDTEVNFQNTIIAMSAAYESLPMYEDIRNSISTPIHIDDEIQEWLLIDFLRELNSINPAMVSFRAHIENHAHDETVRLLNTAAHNVKLAIYRFQIAFVNDPNIVVR